MNKVYEKPCVNIKLLSVQDLVTTSLGFELGQDKSWQDNPWEDATNGGANQ
jgi:hypothetical protein